MAERTQTDSRVMDYLTQVGDVLNYVFGGLARGIERGLTALFGSANARYLKRLQPTIDRINQLEDRYRKMTDAQLREQTDLFKKRLQQGETLDDILPEAFAVCREAGRRWLNMRHYDVQLIGGIVLHEGKIAEMATGEGKTLVATLPAYLNALTGRGVHVVTVNDYLARRDMEWMGPLYMGLGLTVGAIYADMDPEERRRAYDADITYGTNNEFGFDYLRDNMKPAARDDKRYPPYLRQVQRGLNYAIIDEVDNILIDEARTPLIISGPAHDDVRKYVMADRIARQLKRDVHFEVKEKEHTCHLTEEGIREAERLAGVESFYTPGNMEWPHLIDNALKAHHLYKRDVNYIVQDDQIIIVDEFTGRLMHGRQWSDGLHQAVEAKEGVTIKEENQTLATITLQNYFKLYKKIAGMTGTAMTEAAEFWKVYGLEVIAIPTNKPLRRINHPDVIFRTEREKFNAIAEEIERMNKWDILLLEDGQEVLGTIHREDDQAVEFTPRGQKSKQRVLKERIRSISRRGRPILVGTTSIEKSERLSRLLTQRGIPHQVLNAKHHKREAEIIAQAGRKGAVTIATNMAGRGTDIILGGNPETMAWAQLQDKYASRLDVPKEEWEQLVREIEEKERMKEEGREVAAMGGLHVIGTERHESRRIDNQLRGRAGRQGDPGSSRFYLSLEDDLMRIFAGEWVKNVLTRLGMKEGEAIESRLVSRRVEGAQKKVEELNFERRKHLLEYDEVMDEQRKRVYGYRQRILEGGNCKHLILEMIDQEIDHHLDQFLDRNYGLETFAQWIAQRLGVDALDAEDFRGMEPQEAVQYAKEEAERAVELQVQDALEDHLPEGTDPSEWNWEALAKLCNQRWHLSVRERELKRIGRDNLYEYLVKRAQEYIQNLDCSEGHRYLDPDYGLKSALEWLAYKFGLRLSLEEIRDKEPEEIKELVRQRVREIYRQKEIQYPVMVAMYHFSGGQGRGQRQLDREGLAHWAAERFQVDVSPEAFRNKQRDEIVQQLEQYSAENYQRYERDLARAEEFLASLGAVAAEQSRNGQEGSAQGFEELAQWMEQQLHAEVTAEQLAQLDPEQLRVRVLDAVEEHYHPEMRRMERQLVLHLLDTAWKDHLLAMDHLRASVGLRGYAQVDPKVEYKREGMRIFDQMWQSLGRQVTDLIFRMEHLDEGFVGSTWTGATAVHEEASEATEMLQQQQSGSQEQAETKPEPIRNRGPRVRRNDPCPCGSGKKFKHCCMRRVA